MVQCKIIAVHIFYHTNHVIFIRITHFAAVLSEIELLWCTERRRQNKKNNPEFVFYNANAVSIQKHGLKLREETDKLKDALKSNHEFVKDFGAE